MPQKKIAKVTEENLNTNVAESAIWRKRGEENTIKENIEKLSWKRNIWKS